MVCRTFKTSDIEKIIYHKNVIHLSTENGEKGDVDVNKDCWVGTYLNNEIVGIFVFEPLNSVSLDVHCYFLPKHRKNISNESYAKSIMWIFDNSKYKKLLVKCSKKDWHVKNFCLSKGFKLEGLLEKSTMVNGKLVDEYILGLTKDKFMRLENV